MSTSGQILIDETGSWELDLGRGELRAHGLSVPLGGRAFEIFGVLAEASGELVTKDELMRRVWPGAIVEENTLQVHVSAIRRALGPDGPRLRTVSGRGYRLHGDWAPRRDASIQAAPSKPAAPRPAMRTNLPPVIVPLVGRAFAAGQVERMLAASRVVTLTGPGGIGKTALATEVARTWVDGDRREVYLIDLASVSNPDLVASAVAGVTDIRLGSGDASAASVARALGARHMLHVMDNCEHVIQSAAETVETLIQNCPGISVLATSREALRVEGEAVYRVGPLGFPPEQDQEPDAILAQSAVQLFMARIGNLDPTFLADDRSIAGVASICRQLDGIPLAIEFAAARAATLGLQQVAARLDDRFGLLTAGRRTALPRHQTLRATLDWSYDLLPEWERHLLCRCAIFPAGFTVEGASAVSRDIRPPQSSVLDGIANLVAKSLVTFDGAPDSGRWRQLETTRAYAVERLVESGEIHQVTRRATEFLRDVFKASASAPAPEHRSSATDRRDIDNVRWAIEWAGSSPDTLTVGLELTAYSAPLWFRLSLMFEYRRRVEKALEQLARLPSPEPAIEMRLQTGLGYSLWYSGPDTDPERMSGAFARARALAEEHDDPDILMQSLWGTWALARGAGDHERAADAAERYDTVAGALGGKRNRVLADRMLALTRHDLGDHAAASRHALAVIAKAPVLDPESNIDLQVDANIAMRTTLARVQWIQGFPEQANATVQGALDAALRLDHWFSICYVLFLAGCPVSLWNGDLREAEVRAGMLKERTGGNPGFTRHWEIISAALRLRQGDESDRLRAAYVEPRIQYSTMRQIGDLVAQPGFAVPEPQTVPTSAPWSLPEVLRVDAEIILWRQGSSALAEAESTLRQALALARGHGALSWELRVATSLARVWRETGRSQDGRRLLAETLGRFTEGFRTADLVIAADLLETF